jgi:two-component system, LytTR family, sensor kinase
MNLQAIYTFLNKRPVIHAIYWILFVLIGSFIFSYQQNFPYSFFLINFLVHLPVFVLFTYSVIYYFVPVFLLNRMYWQFFVSLFSAAVFAAFLRILAGRYIYYAFFIPEVLHPKVWISGDIFFINLIWILGPVIIFAMFKYYKNWITSQTIANEAERKQLASELQLLKAQLNPHFLFNIFNSLYVLALQKSDKTPAVISKMSDIFHYVLYECNVVEVSVSKEIKLIEDYIELEKLRYSDRLSVTFTKEMDNTECQIPPMLLYTFVENCFKHGSSPDPDLPWIKLLIRIYNDQFEFEATNSIPKANWNDEIQPGVGLSNVKRRMELLYPKKHELEIRKAQGQFIVRLQIQKNCLQIPEHDA